MGRPLRPLLLSCRCSSSHRIPSLPPFFSSFKFQSFFWFLSYCSPPCSLLPCPLYQYPLRPCTILFLCKVGTKFDRELAATVQSGERQVMKESQLFHGLLFGHPPTLLCSCWKTPKIWSKCTEEETMMFCFLFRLLFFYPVWWTRDERNQLLNRFRWGIFPNNPNYNLEP